MASDLTNLDRLCIHTITTKPWALEVAIEAYASRGVKGISVWQEAVAGREIATVGRQIREAGLEVVSYVRGGFFPATSEAGRQKAINANKRMIDEAHALGAPMLVLVCGAEPHQSLEASRAQIQAGIRALLPHAKERGIKLGIEPLHPMYADTRSAITTMAQANAMAESLADPLVGIVVDVYHCWWDDQLEAEIQRCGKNQNLFAFHVCDWKVPTKDMLNDRGLMGEGCIPIRQIRSWVEAAGFDGFIEVEIFSEQYWADDQSKSLDQIIEAYLRET